MKKALKIIKTVIVSLVISLAVFMMIFTVVSVTTFNKNDRSIFGYKAFTVTSDSMSKTDFAAGDLIFIKYVEPHLLNEGDIITYVSQNTENYGENISHKILRKTTDDYGNPGFITYGTTTGDADETVVTYPYILGRYEGRIPKLGTFFTYLKTPQGYIVCIFIPFMLLILYQGIECVRIFRQYKKEQLADMAKEKEQLDKERAEAARMMAEIQALKAQLEGQKAAQADAEKASDGGDEQ